MEYDQEKIQAMISNMRFLEEAVDPLYKQNSKLKDQLIYIHNQFKTLLQLVKAEIDVDSIEQLIQIIRKVLQKNIKQMSLLSKQILQKNRVINEQQQQLKYNKSRLYQTQKVCEQMKGEYGRQKSNLKQSYQLRMAEVIYDARKEKQKFMKQIQRLKQKDNWIVKLQKKIESYQQEIELLNRDIDQIQNKYKDQMKFKQQEIKAEYESLMNQTVQNMKQQLKQKYLEDQQMLVERYQDQIQRLLQDILDIKQEHKQKQRIFNHHALILENREKEILNLKSNIQQKTKAIQQLFQNHKQLQNNITNIKKQKQQLMIFVTTQQQKHLKAQRKSKQQIENRDKKAISLQNKIKQLQTDKSLDKIKFQHISKQFKQKQAELAKKKKEFKELREAYSDFDQKLYHITQQRDILKQKFYQLQSDSSNQIFKLKQQVQQKSWRLRDTQNKNKFFLSKNQDLQKQISSIRTSVQQYKILSFEQRNKQINDIGSRHQKQKQEIKNRFDRYVAELIVSHKDDLKKQELKYDQEAVKIKKQFFAMLNNKESKYKSDFQKKFQNTIKMYQQKIQRSQVYHRQDIARLRKQHQRNIQAVVETYKLKINDLEFKLNNKHPNTEKKENQEKIKEVKEQLNRQIEKNNNLRKKIDRIKKDLKEQITIAEQDAKRDMEIVYGLWNKDKQQQKESFNAIQFQLLTKTQSYEKAKVQYRETLKSIKIKHYDQFQKLIKQQKRFVIQQKKGIVKLIDLYQKREERLQRKIEQLVNFIYQWPYQADINIRNSLQSQINMKTQQNCQLVLKTRKAQEQLKYLQTQYTNFVQTHNIFKPRKNQEPQEQTNNMSFDNLPVSYPNTSLNASSMQYLQKEGFKIKKPYMGLSQMKKKKYDNEPQYYFKNMVVLKNKNQKQFISGVQSVDRKRKKTHRKVNIKCILNKNDQNN